MINYLKTALYGYLLFCSLCFASSTVTESFIDLGETKVLRKHYSEVSSTQDEIEKYLENVSPHQWVMVSADKQEGGRGLWGRRWVSPEGNVFLTYSLFMEPMRARYLPIIPALAVRNTLEEYGLSSKLRWVNNVLVNNQKIGGILCEGAFQFPYFQAKIGIGINVNMTKEVCDTIGQPVTSLLCLLKNEVSTEDVIQKVTQHLYALLSNPQNDAGLIPDYRQSLTYTDEKVQIFDGKQYYEGVFKGVNDFGHLILQMVSGEETFSSGEIVPRQ
jgi:BirA family biotin operon repressor/biotin-[acetyl-CoA-carboxylase] ligase